MAINGYTVGRDIDLNIHTAAGELSLPTVANFEISPTSVTRQADSIQGVVNFVELPKGYSGSITIDRQTPGLEEYWTDYEAQYYAGENLLSSTINVTIREADGSITQWLATGVMFKATNFGSFNGDNIVAQTLHFSASRYIRIL